MNRLTFATIFLSGAMCALVINFLSDYIKTQKLTALISLETLQTDQDVNHYLQNAFFPLPDEGHIQITEEKSTLETVIHNLKKSKGTAKADVHGISRVPTLLAGPTPLERA
jgi:hypothetical protein